MPSSSRPERPGEEREKALTDIAHAGDWLDGFSGYIGEVTSDMRATARRYRDGLRLAYLQLDKSVPEARAVQAEEQLGEALKAQHDLYVEATESWRRAFEYGEDRDNLRVERDALLAAVERIADADGRAIVPGYRNIAELKRIAREALSRVRESAGEGDK